MLASHCSRREILWVCFFTDWLKAARQPGELTSSPVSHLARLLLQTGLAASAQASSGPAARCTPSRKLCHGLVASLLKPLFTKKG